VTATAALLLVSALWGGTFVAIKSGLGDASPLLFVGLRFLFATVAALPLLRSRAAFRGALRAGVPLGIVLALAYATQTLGLVTTTPARSAFVTALNVSLCRSGRSPSSGDARSHRWQVSRLRYRGCGWSPGREH
jgi:drug/metabolite transporter (DMT)-like permease